jgi:monoamine oxidase
VCQSPRIDTLPGMTASIDLLETLRSGLSAAGPRRHIVIIGAGIAGLTAGMVLKEAGHTVSLLEARNRLGGRIYTYRGFAGKMYGEFGAMRFPRQHHLAQHLIHERFKLATQPFGMEDQDTFVYLQGRGVRRSQFTGATFEEGLGPDVRSKEPTKLLHEVMAPLIELVSQPGGWDKVIEQYDRYSLLGYLLERGVTEQALWLLGPLFNIEGRFHFSLVEWFAHWYDDVFGDLEYIVDGADTLPGSFAPILLDDTRLGAEVQSIDQQADGVSVRYRDATGGRGEVRGDEVIITVPLVLLRHMEITGLDVDKWFTIRNVYYGRAHKIFMQFSRRWWVEDYAIDHGVTVTDLAIRNVVYTPAGQDQSIAKGVLIASYAWEQDSMAYSMLDEQQRVTQAREDLAKIHPEAAETFEFGISYDWALDRHGGGIGPLFRPYEMTGRFFDDIRRPVGRVWFAGDACSRLERRWIEGAIGSAVQTASAIDAGMRNELPDILPAVPVPAT